MPKTKTLEFTGNSRVEVTPTGAEQSGNSSGNTGVSQAALQAALQIIGRLSPEHRKALLRGMGDSVQ
jgi:hypothetical protein